jgi:hypothetical protein
MNEVNTAPQVGSHLKPDITILLSHAIQLRDQAGPPEIWRQLAIVVTDLEKLKALIEYYGI